MTKYAHTDDLDTTLKVQKVYYLGSFEGNTYFDSLSTDKNECLSTMLYNAETEYMSIFYDQDIEVIEAAEIGLQGVADEIGVNVEQLSAQEVYDCILEFYSLKEMDVMGTEKDASDSEKEAGKAWNEIKYVLGK